MYKLLFFLKKTNDEQILNHFQNFTLKYLCELAAKEVKPGKVESSLLLDHKYMYFCELETSSKEEMDKKLNSPAGKELSKHLAELANHSTIIFVDYNEQI
jgi:hypothetical protein